MIRVDYQVLLRGTVLTEPARTGLSMASTETMGRPLRWIPEGRMVEVTARTVQGRFLLKPSERLNQMVIGALGRAQRRYGLVIHDVNYQVNHPHLAVSPVHAKQLSSFMNLVQSKIAREVCRLYDWKDKVWARPYRSIPISNEESEQIERLRYSLSKDYASYCTSFFDLRTGDRWFWFRGSWFRESWKLAIDLRGIFVEPPAPTVSFAADAS